MARLGADPGPSHRQGHRTVQRTDGRRHPTDNPLDHADGDTVIVFFDASGEATDGVRYDNTYAWFMRFEDGRVAEVSAFFDSLEFNELWRRVRP